MFITRNVLIGILGVPATGAAAPTYNWILSAGGSGSNDGSVSTATYRYTLDTASVTTDTALTTAVFNAGAFGDQTSGWVVGGYTGSANATQNKKYTNSSGAMSTSNSSTTSITMQNGWKGACSGTSGYLFGGTFVSTSYKYNIGSNSWAGSTALAQSTGWHACHNNDSTALISGGYNGSSNLTHQSYWAFSSDTRTTGTALSVATRDTTSSGDQTNSYLFCGTTSVHVITVRKLAIASGTESTNFSAQRKCRFSEGAASDTKGVFTGGYFDDPGPGSTANVYTNEIAWSTDTSSAGTSLPASKSQMASYSGAQTA